MYLRKKYELRTVTKKAIYVANNWEKIKKYLKAKAHNSGRKEPDLHQENKYKAVCPLTRPDPCPNLLA